MAKLKIDSIGEPDLLEFLESYSDFSFELKILKLLRDNHIECEHGGLYEDPITGKSREFDIRATRTFARTRLRLAVECKNIRSNFPILISCVPRHEQESYHQVALLSDPERNKSPFDLNIGRSRATTYSITSPHSIYSANELVGKSTAQVGRSPDGNILANDSELYEKWAQCLSSANDLVRSTYWDGMREDKADSGNAFYSAVMPFVVVPNGRLWKVVYDENGNRVSAPEPTDRCSCFVNKDYEMGTKLARCQMWLSHVEIVTFDGMMHFIDAYLRTEESIRKIFSMAGLRKAFDRKAGAGY